MQSPRVIRNVPLAVEALAHDPVNKKTSVTHVQHNLPRLDLLRLVGLNGEKIARPQRREAC